MCVILTTNETSIDDPTLIDKESILCSLNIKTMSFHPGTAVDQPAPSSQPGTMPDRYIHIIIIVIDIFRVAETVKTIARTTVLEGR